jgi:hypothetical protein
MTADIIARVRLYETGRGGRQGPTPPDRFGCVFEIDGEYFDCRLLLEGVGSLAPGQTATVPIKFLHPDLLVGRLSDSVVFHLWEGKPIAEGEIKQIVTLQA